MKGWLLDTNVVSELRKRQCHPNVKTWADAQAPNTLYLSKVTIAEIRYGVERHPDVAFRREPTSWLDLSLRAWFAERILELDEEVILTWRRLVELGRGQNHTFAQPDLFIAATAVVHDLCVVTRNIDDFQRAGVSVLNPWMFADPARRP